MEDWESVGKIVGGIAGGLGTGAVTAWRILTRKERPLPAPNPERSIMNAIAKLNAKVDRGFGEAKDSQEKTAAGLKECAHAIVKLCDRLDDSIQGQVNAAAEIRLIGERVRDLIQRSWGS